MSVFVLSEIGGLREAFAAAGFDPGSMAWLSDAISGALTVADVQVRFADCLGVPLIASDGL